jgi:hypothetical protein
MTHVLGLTIVLAAAGGSVDPPSSSAPGKVLLMRSCDDAPEVTQLLAWLSVELSQRNWSVTSDVGPGPGSTRPCLAMARRRAHRRFDNARGLFEEKLRHDAARLELEQALAEFHKARSLLDAPALYAKVRFYLGWIDHALDRRDSAAEHFSAAARVHSPWRPDAAQFPPDVVTRYRAAVAQSHKAGKSRFAVVTEPRGATVWLDGQKVCKSPCALSKLSAGEHFVRLTRAGHATVQRRVVLAASGKQKLDVRLRRDRRERLAALAEADGPRRASEILELAQEGAAVLVAPGPAPSVVRVHAAVTGVPARGAQIEVRSEDPSRRLRAFLDRFLPPRPVPIQAATTVRTGAASPSPGPTGPAAGPTGPAAGPAGTDAGGLSVHRWRLWAVVGVAAAACAVGAAAFAASRAARDEDLLTVAVRP